MRTSAKARDTSSSIGMRLMSSRLVSSSRRTCLTRFANKALYCQCGCVFILFSFGDQIHTKQKGQGIFAAK